MPSRNAELAGVRSLAHPLLPLVAVLASLGAARVQSLTRYSRYATPANAFTRGYSKHQLAGEGVGGGQDLERGGDGAARTGRLRRAGGGVSARDLRLPDRRIFRAARREARTGDVPQVRAAGVAPAQPAGGREGQAPRVEGPLPGERGAPDPRDQSADGRRDDAGGHPALVHLLSRPAGRSGAVAGRALRGPGEGGRGEAGVEAFTAQGAGAAPRREPQAGESVRQGHGAYGLRNHRTGRAREGVRLL